MPTDDAHEDDRPRTGPRHAAPRKPLLTRLHLPAGKAVALVAMPSAVLMGLGFTPQLAQAKPTAPPNPFGDALCATAPDKSPTATPSSTPSTSADASPSASEKKPPKASPSPAGDESDEGKGDKPAPAPSPTRSHQRDDDASKPVPAPSHIPGATPSGTPTASPSATPSPSTSATKSPSPSATPSPSGGKTAEPSATPHPATPKPTGKEKADRTGETKEPTASPSQKAEPSASPSESASPSSSPSATPSPSASASKTPPPCPKPDPKGDRGQAVFADNPWFLESSRLTLHGATFEGVKKITTGGGKEKTVLKFTASGLDIKNMHALVNDRGHVLHQTGFGATSTITNGKVTMYTEEMKGKLLGILPVDWTPSKPPPMIPGLPMPIPVWIDDVKVRQAGQTGGTLTNPNLVLSITNGTYP